jgi:large subunit ribosomal protein L19
VERVFPYNTPRIASVEVTKRGSVRRAKLNYLRKRVGKEAVQVKELATR